MTSLIHVCACLRAGHKFWTFQATAEDVIV